MNQTGKVLGKIYFKIIFLFYFKVHHLSEHKWQNCEHNNAAAYSVDVFFSLKKQNSMTCCSIICIQIDLANY